VPDQKLVTIQVDSRLRDRFLEVCREHDTTMSQVIRRFIRNTVEAADAVADPLAGLDPQSWGR